MIWRWWPAAVVAMACVAFFQATRPEVVVAASPREVEIMARQYAYEPHRIVVDPGDEVHLRLASTDVVHGFYLEGHDIEAEIRPGSLTAWARRPSTGEDFRELEEIVFTAGRPGKYRYRCSVTCGTLHPFMQGEMIVRPNLLYRASLIAACGLTLGIFGLMMTGALGNGVSRATGSPPCNLLVLFFFVVAGFFGSPIGNRNIIVTIVWILWWFLLITVLVPAGGRVWCMACPVPFAGEWLARRRLIGVRREAERSRSLRTGGLNRRWPHRLSRMWLQNLLFLTVCTVSTILVTRPALTAAVLMTMVVAAVAMHALYKRRSFCRYLCPLNAWLSVYSMASAT
ncbi:MAG: 4Fe-4S binding protein, partial [Planctomycetota bacterium]